MEWETYRLEQEEDSFSFMFYSEGPKGRVKKSIVFQPNQRLGQNVFNLAFGDFDEVTKRMEDAVVTNNGDHLKILHTVAWSVIEFLGANPNAFILIMGSTSSRTRLYQMRIAGLLSYVTQQFEILGELEEKWVPFESDVNYKRFLVYRKIK